MTNREFEPSVRGGFEVDNAFHVRNLRAMKNYLLSPFVGKGQVVPGAITEGALGPGAVTDVAVGDVSVSKLTSGVYSAIGQMAGAWVADHLRFDETGIHLVDDVGAVLFSLDSAGVEPFIRGQIEALGLLVENDFVLRGENNLIEAGAKIRMGGAFIGETVGDPAATPGLAVEWETLSLPETPIRRGLSWDATNTSWWSSHMPEGPGIVRGAVVQENDNDASLTLLRGFIVNGSSAVYGAVRLGTRVYVLARTGAGTVLRTYAEATTTFLGETLVSSGTLPGGLGTDGTDIIVCHINSSGNVQFRKYTPGDVPVQSSSFASSGAGNPSYAVTDQVTGFAAAEGLWWVSIGSHHEVQAWSTAGVYSANRRFTNGRAIRGLTHDGTRFWTLAGTELVKHTNWTWTTESAVYKVAYSYVDDNGAVSAGARPLAVGDFETEASPIKTITMLRRARMRASAAAVDVALTGITHVGWYMERGAAALDYQADTTVVDGVQTVRIIEDFTTDASPEAVPAANTFPAGAANLAEFISSSGAPILRANGYPRCKLRETVNQSIPNTTDTTVDFSGATIDIDTDNFVSVANDEIVAPFTGQFWVAASARFLANATGYRTCFLERWNGATWDDTLIFDGARDNAMPSASLAGIAQFATIVNLAAGDRIRFRVAQASTVALDLIDWNLQFLFLGDQ